MGRSVYGHDDRRQIICREAALFVDRLTLVECRAEGAEAIEGGVKRSHVALLPPDDAQG